MSALDATVAEISQAATSEINKHTTQISQLEKDTTAATGTLKATFEAMIGGTRGGGLPCLACLIPVRAGP